MMMLFCSFKRQIRFVACLLTCLLTCLLACILLFLAQNGYTAEIISLLMQRIGASNFVRGFAVLS